MRQTNTAIRACLSRSFTIGAVFLLGVAMLTACDRQDAARSKVDQPQTDQPQTDQPQTEQPKSDQPKTEQPKQEQPKKEQPAPKHVKHPANRLAKETSPYLLMHAHNPVDWYPWGKEALAKAKKENKPIFLSIGYSSCHWCHVMEKECFIDEKIAKIMNEHFVCIKVDREERPDVDEVYMTSLRLYFQGLGSRQSGGWPLSMFLTPDTRPIMGGTYFSPEDFIKVLKFVNRLWTEEPDRVNRAADQLTRLVKLTFRQTPEEKPVQLSAELLKTVQEALENQFDETYGGFGRGRTKFPEVSNLEFLFDRHRRTGDETARKMLLKTLEMMAGGGIRDHVGGGFHRYTVDPFWRIPHFEKMLYDNGQLASAYSWAYLLTKKPYYRRIVDEQLEFILREMTDKQGGFYSALDADSEGEEGKFYVWGTDELKKLLSEDEFALIADVYGVGPEPNFEGGHTLLLARSWDKTAADLKLSDEQLAAKLKAINAKLFAERSKRERPLTDTKILTAWNGLMIRGLADAGRVFEEPRYIKAASRAAEFVLANLRTKDGRLLRTYTAGEAKLNAYLDDYAYLADGLIALFHATGEERWLQVADELTQKQIELFWDEEHGGFYYTSKDHETLFVRTKKGDDNVRPAGNSVAACNLVTLAVRLKKPAYLDRAEKTMQSIAPRLSRVPTASPRMMVALAAWLEAKGKGE